MRLIDADKIDFNEVFIGASEFAKDTREAAQMLIDNQPTVEAVPKTYADQIRWERDIAVKQLNEIGCQFGQKMDEVKKKLEAVPVVYGEWKNMAEHNDHLHCKCSICGFTTENYQAIKNWGISSDDYLEYKWNFCPKCGTRMRKKV